MQGAEYKDLALHSRTPKTTLRFATVLAHACRSPSPARDRKEVSITAYQSFPATLVSPIRTSAAPPITVDKCTNRAYMIQAHDQDYDGGTPFSDVMAP